MRSRLRGAGAAQSGEGNTWGAGQPQVLKVRPPPRPGPCQAQPTSGLRWVQVGCALGGGALRRASVQMHSAAGCGRRWSAQHGVGGRSQARARRLAALAATTHLQGPPAEVLFRPRAVRTPARCQGPRGIQAPRATSEDMARSGGCPSRTGVHGSGPITGASHSAAAGLQGSAPHGLPVTLACTLHPPTHAPHGAITAPASQALPRSPPHSARGEEMQHDLRAGHGRVCEHPRGTLLQAWEPRPAWLLKAELCRPLEPPAGPAGSSVAGGTAALSCHSGRHMG